MLIDLLQPLFSSVWSIFLVIVFFGGSIFVHELGHFLAARSRGLHVERFSIGFGPAIISWYRNGVEYRIAWIPLGGYVMLPQLADLGPLEGKSEHSADSLPPVSYSSKIIVLLSGVIFNALFALVLASVIWVIGQPEYDDEASTQIGYVVPTLTNSAHQAVRSPASEAGLQVGDVIRQIDGNPVKDWDSVQYLIALGTGQTAGGQRTSVFTIERQGKIMEVTVHPVLTNGIRTVGISAGYDVLVLKIAPGSIAEVAGFRPGDQILKVDGVTTLNRYVCADLMKAGANRKTAVLVKRDAQEITLTLPPHHGDENRADIGLSITTTAHLTYPTPVTQISRVMTMTLQALRSLLNRHSDVGLRDMSGPIDIFVFTYGAAKAGIRYLLAFTILVNINLAIFNLLPIPILDGGQMLLATISRLRRRAFSPNFLMAAHSLSSLFLLIVFVYISYFNIQRLHGDLSTSSQAAPPPAQSAPAKP